MGEDDKKQNLDLLRKVAALARDGIGGEKEAAQAKLKKLCDKYGLDYEQTLRSLILEQYEIDVASYKLPLEVVLYAFCKYGMPEGWDGTYSHRGTRWLYLETTKELFEKAKNMIPSIRARYEKELREMKKRHKIEKKVFPGAFRDRNALYYPYKIKQKEKGAEDLAEKMTEKEKEELRIRIRMAADMDAEPIENIAGLIE